MDFFAVIMKTQRINEGHQPYTRFSCIITDSYFSKVTLDVFEILINWDTVY